MFVPRSNILLLDHVAHGHEIFQALFEDSIHADTVYVTCQLKVIRLQSAQWFSPYV